MEPFTAEEETALYDKLDRLSVAELESYIGSARNSLGNRALNASWRPRIELALARAEIVHVREEAAAALLAAEPPAVVVAPVAKAKRTTKAQKAALAEHADKGDKSESESESESEADESETESEADEA